MRKYTTNSKSVKKIILLLGIYAFSFCLPVYGQSGGKILPVNQEVPLSNDAKPKLATKDNSLHLNYPRDVERIYREAGKQLLWIAPDTVKMHAADAMMMLDCVLQYGLNYDDYHPKALQYGELNRYTAGFSKTSLAAKLCFDRLLTDAMLTFINDLHYGKLNPARHSLQNGGNGSTGFTASSVLLKALGSTDFDSVITSVQPKLKAYTNLQYRMHLLEGGLTAECYSLPESEIRKMAINMERLRWIEKNEPIYIQVNIPSLILTFITPDSAYKFKVIVGKPSSPSLSRQDAISSFTLRPNGSAELMAFQLNKLPVMSIRGMAETQTFCKQNRAITTGYIAVDQPAKLAALLLKYDSGKPQLAKLNQAIYNGKKQEFSLEKRVPVIITYLTLEINEGIVVSYKDIYNKDKDLEMALYNKQLPLVLKNKNDL